jgi:hypothetical protein
VPVSIDSSSQEGAHSCLRISANSTSWSTANSTCSSLAPGVRLLVSKLVRHGVGGFCFGIDSESIDRDAGHHRFQPLPCRARAPVFKPNRKLHAESRPRPCPHASTRSAVPFLAVCRQSPPHSDSVRVLSYVAKSSSWCPLSHCVLPVSYLSRWGDPGVSHSDQQHSLRVPLVHPRRGPRVPGRFGHKLHQPGGDGMDVD